MASSASSRETDLLVLGGGIAGMLLAERASAAGREVLILERGLLPARGEDAGQARPLPFNAPPSAGRARGDYYFAPVYAVGGSTSHFFGNLPRLHPAHLEARAFGGADRRWPLPYAELEPYYLQAEARLRVTGDSERTPFRGRFAYPLPPHRLSPMDRASAEIFGAEHVLPVPCARPSRPVDECPACCGSNRCMHCPIDSKITALNTVHPALGKQVEIATGLLVREIRCEGRRAVEVRALDARGETRLFRGREVVVACNGVDSPLLLLASPSVPRHSALGRFYMDHASFRVAVHGSGLDARPGYGDSAQTGMVTTFFERLAADLPVSMLGEVKGADLAMDAGGGDRESVFSQVLQDAAASRHATGPDFRDRFRELWRSTLLFNFMLETQPLASNTLTLREVTAAGQPLPQFRLELPSYLPAAEAAVEARIRARLPKAEVRVIRRTQSLQHWLGATRYGPTPETGCVDRDLRYYGVDNLFVLSASVFPSSSSANPTLTLAALSLRLGDTLSATGVARA